MKMGNFIFSMRKLTSSHFLNSSFLSKSFDRIILLSESTGPNKLMLSYIRLPNPRHYLNRWIFAWTIRFWPQVNGALCWTWFPFLNKNSFMNWPQTHHLFGSAFSSIFSQNPSSSSLSMKTKLSCYSHIRTWLLWQHASTMTA